MLSRPAHPRRRTAAAGLALALGGLLAGCEDSPSGPARNDPCSSRPAAGSVCVRAATEAASLELQGGPTGAEYLLVPFFALRTASARLGLEVAGDGTAAPTSPPSPDRLPAKAAAPDPAEAFHLALRRREKRLLEAWAARAGADRSALPARRQTTGAAVPTVGQQLTLNTAASCDETDRRTGRVAAVSQRSIILVDVANPAGGLTDADAATFAARFDDLVYPVNVRNFGEPGDIDANGRSIVFFTRAVNELTPPGAESFVGGFFYGGDLLPRTATSRLPACAGSNEAEVFYVLAPDPNGVVNGNRFSLQFVQTRAVGTLGHEFQHLINASRRLFVNNAGSFEEVWLNEGLSHIAEELLFYEASGLGPRRNLDRTALGASAQVNQAFNAYGISNLGRYSQYLRQVETQSVLGPDDDLPTRGAAWAFVRYLADQESGADEQFFRRLVNNDQAGLANLQEVLGSDPMDRLQQWHVSVYTDDAVAQIDDEYTQPSWNFRSVLPDLSNNAGRFPLDVNPLVGTQTFSLFGGGAAYLRFSVPVGSRALVRTTSGGVAPPQTLRASVVRIR